MKKLTIGIIILLTASIAAGVAMGLHYMSNIASTQSDLIRLIRDNTDSIRGLEDIVARQDSLNQIHAEVLRTECKPENIKVNLQTGLISGVDLIGATIPTIAKNFPCLSAIQRERLQDTDYASFFIKSADLKFSRLGFLQYRNGHRTINIYGSESVNIEGIGFRRDLKFDSLDAVLGKPVEIDSTPTRRLTTSLPGESIAFPARKYNTKYGCLIAAYDGKSVETFVIRRIELTTKCNSI